MFHSFASITSSSSQIELYYSFLVYLYRALTYSITPACLLTPSSRPEPEPPPGADPRHRPLPLHPPHRGPQGALQGHRAKLLQGGAGRVALVLRVRAGEGVPGRGDELGTAVLDRSVRTKKKK